MRTAKESAIELDDLETVGETLNQVRRYLSMAADELEENGSVSVLIKFTSDDLKVFLSEIDTAIEQVETRTNELYRENNRDIIRQLERDLI